MDEELPEFDMVCGLNHRQCQFIAIGKRARHQAMVLPGKL